MLQIFNYQFLDFKFDIDFDNDFKHVSEIPYLDFISELQVENVIYKDIAVISNFDNPNSIIRKVFLNKNDGIIQFEDNFHNIWKRDCHNNEEHENSFQFE